MAPSRRIRIFQQIGGDRRTDRTCKKWEIEFEKNLKKGGKTVEKEKKQILESRGREG